MAYLFAPWRPGVSLASAGGTKAETDLLRYYRNREGYTLLKLADGTYREHQLLLGNEQPATVDVDGSPVAVLAVYRGGYRITVDDAEAASLTAAGYGAFLEAI